MEEKSEHAFGNISWARLDRRPRMVLRALLDPALMHMVPFAVVLFLAEQVLSAMVSRARLL